MIALPKLKIIETITNQRRASTQLEEGYCYEGCQIVAVELPLKLNEMKFKHCEFQVERWNRTEILDCHFDHCDFSNGDFDNSTIYRSEFDHCKLLGSSLFQCGIKDAKFSDCLMRYINLSRSTLTNVVWHQCHLQEGSFQAIQFKNLLLSGSDINGCDFSDTVLAGLDLRYSSFDWIRFSPEKVKGLIIRMDQAALLATQFGIITE